MKKSKSQKSESQDGAGKKNGAKNFLIAGIGASAGGIQALKEFFENVPADSGAAYVVILHLSPDDESRLAEILQTTAQIPVTRLKEKVKVEANHVYVVPPSQHLEMLDGHIGAEPNVSVEERRAPVDIFFRTLAESHRARAIAVVLSGTGADGSMGLKRVKERGGAVFVQNPREAEFSEMPRNSIATELVDQVLNVGEIPAQIVAYKDNLGAVEIQDSPASRAENDQAALRAIFAILRVRTGHDFTNYKHPTVLRRIERRINVRELQNLADYAEFIRNNPDEAVALLKDLLISVTNFFRDKEAFQFLETEVVPRILRDKSAEDEIRVWVAGCATGEEAYSLAMLFCEQIENSPVAPKIQIFATDIDEDALAYSREGFYTLIDAADVSPERLRRFFIKEVDGFRVRRELRAMILFAKHNVLKDAPFSHLDLVTCRNLLIYFNSAAQERAMETFHFALNPGAHLFLGTSESVDGAGDLYAPVNKEFRIYQSRQTAAKIAYSAPDVANAVRYVGPKTSPSNVTAGIAGTSPEQEKHRFERISFGDLHRQLLEQYAPPSVVVNENYDIVHLSPQAGRFLHIAGGEPSKNLLHLVRPELRLDLRTALFQAVQRRANVVAANLKFQTNGHAETVNIQVRPVLRQEDTARGFLLVLFEASQNEDAETATEKIIASDEPIARRLEAEFERTKTQLRASIEQYEVQTEELRASNEELQAVNEELRSTAEELETSREELQSVNEELMTVNDELKIKIEALSVSNDDIKNRLNSTDIGTIEPRFVGITQNNTDRKRSEEALRESEERFRAMFEQASVGIVQTTTDGDLIAPNPGFCKIIGYSEAEAKLLNLRDVTHPDDYEREVELTRQLIDGKIPDWSIEKRYVCKNGSVIWAEMTAILMRNAKGEPTYALAVVEDISERKVAQDAVRDSETQMRLVVEAVEMGTWDWDLRTGAVRWNEQHFRLFGREPENRVLSYTDFEQGVHPKYRDEVRERLEQAIAEDKVFQTEFLVLHPDAATRWMSGYGRVVEHDAAGKATRMTGVMFDATERKATEEAVRESEERLRLLVESASDYAIFTMSLDNRIDTWNAGAEKVFGWTESEVVGQTGAIIFTPEDRAKGEPEKEIKTTLANGRAPDERFHLRKDESRFFVSGVMTLLKDAEGNVQGFAKIARDMTEKIEAEKALLDKQMLQKLVSAQEDERKRIARDLHDHLGQQLTGLRLKLESARKVCESDRELCAKIDEIQLAAKRIDADVDFLAWELRPAALDDLGLVAALGNYVAEWSRHCGVSADFHASTFKRTRLAPEAETNLYRIGQEALNNVYKHAGASQVSVLLEKQKDNVVLIIEDNGVGFRIADKKTKSKGLGLIGMSERAAIIGGTLEIESSPKKGTTVFARVAANKRSVKP